MGNARRAIAAVALPASLILPPARSKDEPTPVVEPTSAFEPTGSTGATAASGATGRTVGGGDARTVGVGGLSFTGTLTASPSLSRTITVQDEKAITTSISSAGECTITNGQASGDQVSGAFNCTDLSGGSNVVVDITGSFAAQG